MYHRALTSCYYNTDPMKFKFGTIPEALSTMLRCWTVSPTSNEIVKDITDFERVLQKVVEKNGIVCHEDFLRHGHRALRHDQKGLRKTKLKNRDRIATNILKAYHPDANAAIQNIKNYHHTTAVQLAQVEVLESDESIVLDENLSELSSSDSENDNS